jgi:hypothetical protein
VAEDDPDAAEDVAAVIPPQVGRLARLAGELGRGSP